MRVDAGRGGAPYTQSTNPLQGTNKAIITLPLGTRPGGGYIWFFCYPPPQSFSFGAERVRPLSIFFPRTLRRFTSSYSSSAPSLPAPGNLNLQTWCQVGAKLVSLFFILTQDPPKMPHYASKMPPRCLQDAQDVPRCLQDASKMAQDASKMLTRPLQDVPRCSQDSPRRPKTSPRHPKTPQNVSIRDFLFLCLFYFCFS